MLKIYRIAGTAALAALFIARAALAVDETPKRPQSSAPVSSSLLSVHESDVTFPTTSFALDVAGLLRALSHLRNSMVPSLDCGPGLQGFVTSLTGRRSNRLNYAPAFKLSSLQLP
jgi:hypothetical protein